MISPEVLNHLPDIVTTLGTLGFLMAFTQKQRMAIVMRDGNKCRATAKHQCNEEKGLEVDHIIPQRYAAEVGIDPDFPENALSKCKNAHNIKHPDRIETLKKYHTLKDQGINAFAVLGEERKKKLKEKLIYWNSTNDRTDSVMAIRLTQNARKAGWVFPERKIAQKPEPEDNSLSRMKPLEVEMVES